MDGFIELLIHGLLLVGYGVLTVVLTAVSTFVEYNSYLSLSTGESLLGGWMALIGLLVFVFAYFVLRDKVVAEYRYLVG
ncbi:hypothetical protein HAPAU_22500 [Halalkalicoccus paucihalophilus]|uniref:DUF8151 domain-containing protein n=1 Tax=Halalkalicoccus paucihalophilus TaxID=1008153 RepID=A0A151AD35_9EURY|nr:hypothetical protein [Halalkalicoccus paucihalophilus]KYH25576.1 hypothetical protein HAPAU_22500 [Halalkalicoccus paucihalophilus]